MTESTLVWLDVETTSLLDGRRAWDIAAIVRRPGQPDVEWQWFVGVYQLDLTYADPESLRIGGFWDRHPQARWVREKHGMVYVDPSAPHPLPADGVVDEQEALTAVAGLTTGRAVILGSNPAFDQSTLGARMRWYDMAPGWYYHPADVPERAKGWLAAQGRPVPDRTDDVVRACGLDPDWYERHTALGDCRLFRDLHRIVTQPPKRPPAGGWPIGGRPARRWRTCAGCGDDIWPNELVYPADASGDTSEAAGVQCAVCERRHRASMSTSTTWPAS